MATEPWTTVHANTWYAEQSWVVGCNFVPSNAVNQLEMWQEDSFDLFTIDKELGYAESLGFNTVRVYLHDFLWVQNSSLFLKRIEQFLACADTHSIRCILVFFDACWNNHPHIGVQPAPVLGKHNSGWVQSPSSKILSDKTQWHYLEKYVKGVVAQFKDDKRVLFWDLYNEPGNEALLDSSLELLQCVFRWGRAACPSQPLSVGLWHFNPQFQQINNCIVHNSDVISFHCYGAPKVLEALITTLSQHARPMICTEYMARTEQSLFQNTLPVFKKHSVGALNWGLVNGKTQTHIPWNYYPTAGHGSSSIDNDSIWFHDIFRNDGIPYDENEVRFIKEILS